MWWLICLIWCYQKPKTVSIYKVILLLYLLFFYFFIFQLNYAALIGTDNMSCTIILFKEKNINKTFTVGFELQSTVPISSDNIYCSNSNGNFNNNQPIYFNIDNKSRNSLIEYYKLNKELCEVEYNNKEYQILYDEVEDELKEKNSVGLNISKKSSGGKFKVLCYDNEFYQDKHKSI